MEYLIGIDMGTTNTKAIVFDTEGNQTAAASLPTPTKHVEGGGAVYDPETEWRNVCRLLSSCAEQLEETNGRGERNKIRGIAVTGMGEAGVPLDQDGHPLYPVIAWFDPRTLGSAEELREMLGDEKILQITGLKNQYIFTANKLLWLRRNEPDVFGRMKLWHCMPDYISYRLCGSSAMDYSLACRTMLFDQNRGTWSGDMLDAVGLREEQLPAAVPGGTKIGTLRGEAARECGLPAGIGVYAGGHDHICGALACGVWDADSLLDSSGTAEEILTATTDRDTMRLYGRGGYNCGYHVRAGSYYIAGGIPASGASVDWAAKVFPDNGGSGDPLARGLLFLPHLRGSSSPERSRVSAGVFLGLRDYHTHADLRQAVCEGVCFEMRQMMERISRPKRIVSIGGGTKNKRWLQTKADVTGHRIEVPSVQEATALGAAILAGIGRGIYRDAEDAFAHTYRIGEEVFPNPELTEEYDALFSVFQNIDMAIRPLSADIARLKKEDL